MEPAIRVENLGKLYRVTGGGERANYATLRESVMHAAGAPLRWARKGFAPPDPAEDFWALQDVNFEVQPGEVVGIIGRNGAGKSTLLKILSRITKPTTGRVTLNGRVGSLLEVGTGFHPELTGRENVYLNGSILGMTRREIAKKFDEIVAFAEVERFLDTPVKRYSSGMYVRLAFAVAAHLEPEILIVDEVLAVGDAAFQQKCLGKMSDLASCGRTIFFVSHQMSAVQALCTHAILLDAGRVQVAGKKEPVISAYLSATATGPAPGMWMPIVVQKARGRANFAAFQYGSGVDEADGRLFADGPAEFRIRVESRAYIDLVYISLTLSDRFNTRLLGCDTVRLPQPLKLSPGLNNFVLQVESLHLNPGTYRLGLWMADVADVFDSIPVVAEVQVSEFSFQSQIRSSGELGPVTNTFFVQTISSAGGQR